VVISGECVRIQASVEEMRMELEHTATASLCQCW
jgi:hypothetical protein